MLGLGGTLSSLLTFWLSSMRPLSVSKEVCSTLLQFLSISSCYYFVIYKIGPSLSSQKLWCYWRSSNFHWRRMGGILLCFGYLWASNLFNKNIWRIFNNRFRIFHVCAKVLNKFIKVYRIYKTSKQMRKTPALTLLSVHIK